MPTYGSNSQNYSIIFHSQLLLKAKSSVFMVVSLPVLIPLIKLDNSTEYKKCPTKAPFAICSGQTQMTDVAGVFRPEVLVTRSVKTSQSNLTTLII